MYPGNTTSSSHSTPALLDCFAGRQRLDLVQARMREAGRAHLCTAHACLCNAHGRAAVQRGRVRPIQERSK